MKITKSQLKQIIKEELSTILNEVDPKADINLPGADPEEKELEPEREKAKLSRLRDVIAGLLEEPDESDIKMAKDKLAGYAPEEEE
jgi:hypothetical protein